MPQYKFVQGMEKVGENLKRVPEAVRDHVALQALAAGVTVARDRVKAEAPRGSESQGDPSPGLLKESVRMARRRNGVDAATQIAYVVFVKVNSKQAIRRATKKGKTLPPGAYYYKFVEFGTSRQAAQPFLLTGFLASSGAVLEVARATAADLVEKELPKHMVY